MLREPFELREDLDLEDLPTPRARRPLRAALALARRPRRGLLRDGLVVPPELLALRDHPRHEHLLLHRRGRLL